MWPHSSQSCRRLELGTLLVITVEPHDDDDDDDDDRYDDGDFYSF